jgi:hypothetical protein
MSRDRTARTRIREYLRTRGPVDDPTGYATSALKEAIGYDGTAVAFIQLVAAMDREGEIAREIRGKRTYRISLGQAGAPVPDSPRPVPQQGVAAADLPFVIDYDRLARAVVREFFLQAAQNAMAGGGPAKRLQAERDDYALKLEMARLRLSALLGDRAEDDPAVLRRLAALSE